MAKAEGLSEQERKVFEAKLMTKDRVIADTGLASIADRFREEHAKALQLEAHLRDVRRRRALLALKLVTGNIALRTIGDLVGVSGVHVHEWAAKARGEHQCLIG